MIEDAITLAVLSHAGQVDKAGKPYILHPLRVLGAVGLSTDNDDVMCAAVLHDVVEDCGVKAQDLRGLGLSERTIELTGLLTREDNVSYEHFIESISLDKDASWIKVCDLRDNMDISRLGAKDPKDLTPMQYERLLKYRKAEAKLCAIWGFK